MVFVIYFIRNVQENLNSRSLNLFVTQHWQNTDSSSYLEGNLENRMNESAPQAFKCLLSE